MKRHSKLNYVMRCFFALIAAFAFNMQMEAQEAQKTVKGYVEDESGEPLIGVSVSLPGKQGTVTDIDGKFSLAIPTSAKSITVSYVGYQKKEVKLPSDLSALLKVTMKSATALKDVVINGFFTRDRNTYTGSVTSLKSEDLVKVSPTNVIQALSVLDPAFTITKNNAMGSNPNQLPDLVIRGTTSLATSGEQQLNTPLIVIDGVESSLSALYDMNMQDIERVDILKDASATALYGENAANGVIVIERKRVSETPVRIRYTFVPTVSLADLSSYDMCDSAQKLELERLSGLYSSPSGAYDEEYYRKYRLVSQGINTDWKSKPIRNAFSHSHSVAVTGRGNGMDYSVTGRYSSTDGVMKNDKRENLGLNVYFSYRLKDALIITLRAEHEQLKTKASNYGVYSDYLLMNPYYSPYNEYGELVQVLDKNWNIMNPLYEASLTNFSKTQARTETVSLNVRWNIKPTFYITAQGSVISSRGTGDTFVSPKSSTFANVTDVKQKGSYSLTNSDADTYNGKLVVNYIKDFDKEGTILTMNAGGDIKKASSLDRTTQGLGFLSETLTDISYAQSYPTSSTPTGVETLETSMGAFLAVNMSYKNRYQLDGSFRMSGSSKFGSNNRFAPFWSIGAGYNLHKEKFITDNISWVDIFRIRGSYGYTGSVKFQSFQAITTYQYNSGYPHFSGIGAIPMAMGNPDLSWQTTKKFNVGLTSSFMKQRFSLNLDVYRDHTDDMLIDVSMPPSAGTSTVKDNLGSQKSVGVEFSLWAKPIITKSFVWTFGLNGLHNTTTILGINDALRRKNKTDGEKTTEAAPRILYEEGGSPTAIYAVRSAGIDPATGKEIFIKKNGEYTFVYNADDKVVCGDLNPKIQGTISSTFSYANFNLALYMSYTLGGDVYNTTRAEKIENINPRYNADVRSFNERWSKPGDVANYLAFTEVGGTSYVHTSRFVERENEIYLSSMSLSYDFPSKMIKKMCMQKLNLAITFNDLFRFSSVKYERGTSYPYSRDISMTLNVTF